MAIWIQSLAWALICAWVQGFTVFVLLRLLLKAVPMPANIRYHLSLSALTVLLVWFLGTWWQQFRLLAGSEILAQAGSNTFSSSLKYMELTRGGYSFRTALLSVRPLFPWLAACYCAGLMFMLGRFLAGVFQLFSLGRRDAYPAAPRLHGLLISLKTKLHVHTGVRLMVSSRAGVPMVICILKPVVLMPAAVLTQLSTEQLEAILLHELAHIKRYDHIVNILQALAETVLFFNPFAWMVSAIIRREREHCCDDLVLTYTPEPLSYATALATLAGSAAAYPAFAVAATSAPTHLFNRIKRIMEMKKNPVSYSRMVAAIVIMATLICTLAWLTPSFAETRKDKEAKAKTSAQIQDDSMNADLPDETILVRHLCDDHMVDETKGFLLEKNRDKLFIDGRQVADDIAARYLHNLKQEFIRVQVFPFSERIRMHPDAGILQLIAPISFPSGCVQYTPPPKPGC